MKPLLGLDSLPGEIETTKSLYLGWIRDMKSVHPVAAWCWQRLKTIYDEELFPPSENEVRGGTDQSLMYLG